jgi:type IV pilus assembly protein PilA
MMRGFTIVELLVVIAIIAILASIAILQYLNYTERARLASYALPMARACMADVASYCSADPPPTGTVTYSIIEDSAFPNCVATCTTPGGTVYFTVVEAFFSMLKHGTVGCGKVTRLLLCHWAEGDMSGGC